MPLKILLVDNNQLFLNAVRHLLVQMPEVDVVGEAQDGLEAMSKIKELEPDLVLLDIAMPKLTGLDVALRLQSWPQAPKILFLTMHDDAYYQYAARDLGAINVVGKKDLVADLLPIIRTLIANQVNNTATPNS